MIVDRDGDFNFALVTCLPAVLALLVVTLDLLGGGGVEWGLLAIGLTVAVVYSAATAYFLIEQGEENRFRAWLLSSVPAIERGEGRWGNVLVLPNTELRRFQVLVSVGFMSFTVQLRPRIAGGEDLRRVKAISTAFTLLMGWWFLTGPLLAPVIAFRNARGGLPCTVAEYHA